MCPLWLVHMLGVSSHVHVLPGIGSQGSTSDKCPQLVNGQVLVTINGESLEGLNVAQVCDRLKVRLHTQV
jgi:hypothetical protein